MANIISTNKKKKFRIRNKKLVAALVVMGIGAIVAAVVYFNNNKNNAPVTDEYQQSMNRESDELEAEFEGVNSGNYDSMQASHESDLAKADGNNQKASVRLDQSSLAYLSNNLTDAERYALEAEQLNPTELTARQLATVYVGMNNNEKALTYYKLALERLAEDDDSGTRQQNYEAAIRRIEG